MKSEAQPLRITTDTEPAKPWFVGRNSRLSSQTVHVGNRFLDVLNAEEHEKTKVRIASMHTHFKGGTLKPSPSAWAKWMELPAEHLLSGQLGPPLPPGAGAPPPPETSGPTFRQALREQLGLKLVQSMAPVRTIVIDHFERPSEN
jgi:Protein of unknown function (DUF3738)